MQAKVGSVGMSLDNVLVNSPQCDLGPAVEFTRQPSGHFLTR
jgi:hypothetical protein